MAKKKAIHYPRRKPDIPKFYSNAATKLDTGGIGAKYGISVAKINKVKTDSTSILQATKDAAEARATAESKTKYENEVYKQSQTNLMDIFVELNNNPALEESDAEALGMRVVHTPPDYDNMQPVFDLTYLSDRVRVGWLKGYSDGVIVKRRINDGAWETLDRDTRSPFDDKQKNQTEGVPEVRKYKLTYFKGDENIGKESDVKEIIVLL